MKDIKKPQVGFLDINPTYLNEARQLILNECGESTIDHFPMYHFEEADYEIEDSSMFFPVTKDFSSLTSHSLAE